MGHYAYLPTHYTTGCGRTGGVEIGGRRGGGRGEGSGAEVEEDPEGHVKLECPHTGR